MCEVLDKIIADGEVRGEARGEVRRNVSVIRKKLQKSLDIPTIADCLELDEKVVAEIAQLIDENPISTDREIAEEYLRAHA